MARRYRFSAALERQVVGAGSPSDTGRQCYAEIGEPESPLAAPMDGRAEK